MIDDPKKERHETFQRLGAILAAPEVHADLQQSVRLSIRTTYEALMNRIHEARQARKRDHQRREVPRGR